MASSKNYLDFILNQLSELENITYRAMMGEYIIYYNEKIIGGIYDDRLLVKPIRSALDYIKNIEYKKPYDGAKEMILVDDVDDVDDEQYLVGLFKIMYTELQQSNSKKKK